LEVDLLIKRTAAILLCALILVCPTTAFAATENPQQSESEDSGTVSIITLDEIPSRSSGAVGSLYYPLEIKTVAEDGEKLVIKTFEVPAGVNPTLLIEESFEKGGIVYEPREILKRSLPGAEETRLAAQTVTVESESGKLDDIIPLLNPLLDYSEGGFSGQLQLDRESIYAKPDGYRSYQYPVTEVRELPGMDRNDLYYIPKTATSNGAELTLNDVRWTPMGYGEARGRLVPSLYTATAEYTGYATGSMATGYTVSATYTGQVSKAIEGNVIFSIIYGAVPVAAEELELLPEPSNPVKESGGLTFGIIVCVIALGAAGTAVIIWFKRRGPIRADGPQAENPRKRIFMPRSMDPSGGADE
jgi:hypothetical protein